MKYCWIILVGLLSGCATKSDTVITESKPELTTDKKALRDAFVGKWQSTQQTEDGNTRDAVITRKEDSRYVVEFTVYYPDQTIKLKRTEFGYWGVSGGIYFTMYRGTVKDDDLAPSDPSNPYNYDAYTIESVSGDELIYQNLTSGNRYVYTRLE